MATWIQNRWGGFNAENLFVGQTWKGFWRVWLGDDLLPQVFTDAADGRAFAESLTADHSGPSTTPVQGPPRAEEVAA